VLPAWAGLNNTVEVTTAARPKLARMSRDIRGVLVFFGVLNIMNEIDCIIRVKPNLCSQNLLHKLGLIFLTIKRRATSPKWFVD
jgi:hypothetical protein